jgi:hypothetical protein
VSARAVHIVAATILALLATSVGAAPASAPRILVLGIDAIPYSVAAAVTDPALGTHALFRGMKGPTAVVSSFPSTSYPAWSRLLAPFGVESSPGYIGKYYMEEEHRVLGVASSEHEEAPWLDFFDWHLEGLVSKAVAYGSSRRSGTSELEKGLQAFMASDKPVFWLYILSTDAMGHEYGPTVLAEFLSDVDGALADLRASAPDRPFYTVLVSDHGMAGGSELVNAWPAVRDAMLKAGFHDARKLSQAGDAIFVPLGILTFFFVHTWPGDEAHAAQVLTEAPGVDLCAHPDGGLTVRAPGSGADPATRRRHDTCGRIARNAVTRLPICRSSTSCARVHTIRTRRGSPTTGGLLRPSLHPIRMRCTGSRVASRKSATRRRCCAR